MLPRCLKRSRNSRQLKIWAKSHIHIVDQHFAFPTVVISLQIICLPLDGCCISTHSIHISPFGANCPQFHCYLPIRPGNCRYRHTSSPLQKNNQHAVCAACGHTATKLSLWSLSKTITPPAWAVTSNLEAQESLTIRRSSLGMCVCRYLAGSVFGVSFAWRWSKSSISGETGESVCLCEGVIFNPLINWSCHRWQAAC